MSQDELAVKIVIDDSQFKDEITRLRRDLEDQYRIEIDKIRTDRAPTEVHYAPQPATIEVRGEVDEGLRKEVRQLREDINKLENKVGLPGQFLQLTINDIDNMIKDAVKTPAWTASVGEDFTAKLLDISQGLASRPYANMTMEGLTDPSQRRYVSGARAALRLYDMVLKSGRGERLEGAGLATDMRVLESAAAMGSLSTMQDPFSSQATVESVSHRILKSVSQSFFTAAGKIATLETNFEGAGMKRRLDVYTLFFGETPGGESGPSMQFPEVKTGRTIDINTVTQVADQIFIALDHLSKEYGITIDDIVKDPKILGEVSGEAARITAGIIALQEHSIDDIQKFQGDVMEMVIGRITTASRASGDPQGTTLRKESQIRAAFQGGGIATPLRVVSDKMRVVIRRSIDESEHMDEHSQVAYVRDKVFTFLGSEEGAEDRAIWAAWHNPTFNPQAQTEMIAKFEAAKNRMATMIAEGALDRPQAEAELRDVIGGAVETGGAFAALDASRQVFGGGSMAGLPSIGVDARGRPIRPTSRVGGRPARAVEVGGRLIDPLFISGIFEGFMGEEIDTRPEAEIREETLDLMSGGITEEAARANVERDARENDGQDGLCMNCGSLRPGDASPCPKCGKHGVLRLAVYNTGLSSNQSSMGGLLAPVWAKRRAKANIFPIIPDWLRSDPNIPTHIMDQARRIEHVELQRQLGVSEEEYARLITDIRNEYIDTADVQLAAGEITQEEHDDTVALWTGEGSPQAMIRQMVEERRTEVDMRAQGLITGQGIPMDIDPVEYRTGMEKVAKEMGFKKFGDFIELIEAKNAKDTTGFFQQRLGTVSQIMKQSFVDAGTMDPELVEKIFSKSPLLGSLLVEAPVGDQGQVASPTQINDFLQGMIKQKITGPNIGQLQKELNILLNDDRVRGLLGAVNLPGAHAINVQMKQYEQANMDLEPAFGGALNYWT